MHYREFTKAVESAAGLHGIARYTLAFTGDDGAPRVETWDTGAKQPEPKAAKHKPKAGDQDG